MGVPAVGRASGLRADGAQPQNRKNTAACRLRAAPIRAGLDHNARRVRTRRRRRIRAAGDPPRRGEQRRPFSIAGRTVRFPRKRDRVGGGGAREATGRASEHEHRPPMGRRANGPHGRAARLIGLARIDAVTLADDGVVFDRGAIGPHPSLIVRRRLRDAKPTIARLKNDPQPDLAPSSAGAFYFWLQHGWMRWDFGRLHPHPTHLNGLRWWVVGYEHGRLLLRTGTKCRPRLVVRVRGKRTQAVTSPTSTPASPKNFGPLCALMTGFAWQGRRLLVARAIIPRISLTAANDVGLVGVVTETTTP